MKITYSYKEICKLVGDDLANKGLYNKETQNGTLHALFEGRKVRDCGNTMEFQCEITEKPKPKEEEKPYETGGWKEDEQ
jgi:hypothetical protein